MMRDDEDRERALAVPFVRGGPPAELWPRIEARARAALRTRRATAWGLRVAAVAAGAALWVLAHALIARDPARGRPSAVASAERAWLREASGELPPEAQLVTQLLGNEEAR